MNHTKNPPYQLISASSILILAVVTWGFYRTYLVFFPGFSGFSMVHHFHGAMMITWITMLIIQPLLIMKGKVRLHKLIGKVSYIVAPLVVVSIFLTAELGYLRPEPQLAHADKVAAIALPIPAMFAFAILYALAVINSRNTHNHLRYIIGTALLMIGPGLGRVLITYFDVPFPVAVTSILILAALISLILAINDVLKSKNYTAYSIVTMVNLMTLMAWQFRMGEFWQSVGSLFTIFFTL